MNLLQRIAAALGIGESDAKLSAVASEATLRGGGIDRRAFLRLLGSGAAGLVVAPALDLDALIWTPKTIVTVGEFAPSYFEMTAEWLTREALRLLEHEVKFANYVNRRYDAELEAVPLGGTIRVRDFRRVA